MITKAAIKKWADENKIPGYESAYPFVDKFVKHVATYDSVYYVGKPAVVPTKAAACDELATFWSQYANNSSDRSKFNQQVVYVARHLQQYYTEKGQ